MLGRRLLTRHAPGPTGFTLVEALVALTIAGVAGSALLLGVTASMHTTGETLHQLQAQGLAQQMLDEVIGARYMEYGGSAYDTTLCPGADETAYGTREIYDDIDDFNGVRQQPPSDRWGVAVGREDASAALRDPSFRIPDHYLDPWRQEVDVYYVDPANPSVRLASGQVSDCRAVEVRIVQVDPQRGTRVLATQRRVVAYVPPVP